MPSACITQTWNGPLTLLTYSTRLPFGETSGPPACAGAATCVSCVMSVPSGFTDHTCDGVERSGSGSSAATE